MMIRDRNLQKKEGRYVHASFFGTDFIRCD